MITLSWTHFKQVVDAKALSIQFVDIGDKYYLRAFDGPFGVECVLNKNVDESDVTDFEGSYKAVGNKPPLGNYVQHLGSDSHSINIRAFEFTATKQTTTVHNFLLSDSENIAVKGGVMFSKNAEVGDFIKAEIVDVDGLYYPPGSVLSEYINKWYVFPGVLNEVNDISVGIIAIGLYLQFTYVSVNAATEDPRLFINIYSYKVS